MVSKQLAVTLDVILAALASLVIREGQSPDRIHCIMDPIGTVCLQGYSITLSSLSPDT